LERAFASFFPSAGLKANALHLSQGPGGGEYGREPGALLARSQSVRDFEAALERRLKMDFGLESDAVRRAFALGRRVDPLPRWSKGL